jgi:hydroxyacylglutathione hydrolase
MKRQNNEGVPLLGALPIPPRLSVDDLGTAVSEGKLLPIDGRPGRAAFMAKHLPGALFSPFTRNFSTVVGSLVEDETRRLLLVVEEEEVEEAVRDLVRIGFDRIDAAVSPATLGRYLEGGVPAGSIPRTTFEEAAAAARSGRGTILDVRYASEFAAGHLAGAINASYTRLPSYTRARVPRGKPLFVHCSTGRRAAPAASYLAREGFEVQLVDEELAGANGVGALETL